LLNKHVFLALVASLADNTLKNKNWGMSGKQSNQQAHKSRVVVSLKHNRRYKIKN
jgi:hypothetical protein